MSRAPKRPRVTVVVQTAEGDPVDLDAWMKRYVEILLETEGVKPRVAPPAAESIG